MWKIIDNSFDFKEPSLQVIDHSFVKKASCTGDDWLKDIKPKEGYVKVLVLFLGAGEYYGCNQNGDYFKEKDLINSHHTFVKYGKFYRHHVNKDPENNYGYIERSRYNKKMRRVEGIICMRIDRCQDLLERLDRGENIPVSMACRVRFDVCSICSNRARTTEEYCVHLKYDLKKIYEDGSQAYAENPDPVFFDLSAVFRPADRTAHTLKKVAHSGPVLSSILAEQIGYVDMIKKQSSRKDIESFKKFIEKVSTIEKEIEPVLMGDGCFGEVKEVTDRIPDFDKKTLCSLKEFPLERVMKTLFDNDIMFTLKDFLGMTGNDDMYEDVASLPCDRISETVSPEDAGFFNLEKDFEDPMIDANIFNRIKKFLNQKSLSKDNLSDKLVDFRTIDEPGVKGFKISIRSGGEADPDRIEKKSAKKSIAEDLRNLYNLYKVSYCHAKRDNIQLLSAILRKK